MKPPTDVRLLPSEERQPLEAGRRSSDALTRRRCQILLGNRRGALSARTGQPLSCATQRVRHAIHVFHTRGLASLRAQSRRPQRTRRVLDAAKREQWRALLPQRPRTVGQPRTTWTRRLAAEGCWERGLTPDQGSIEHSRQALKRLGVSWWRAKSWSTSPDPSDLRNKTGATG